MVWFGRPIATKQYLLDLVFFIMVFILQCKNYMLLLALATNNK